MPDAMIEEIDGLECLLSPSVELCLSLSDNLALLLLIAEVDHLMFNNCRLISSFVTIV